MTERQSEESELKFIPEYADLIAHAANSWAYIEYYISTSIWALADVRPALGACMTSQIFSLHAKLSSLIALAKLRRLDAPIIGRINKFSEQVREAQDNRNRIVHDMWFKDNLQPDQMGRLRITADKTLKFKISSIPEFELRAMVTKISERRTEMQKIRAEILAALPTLPEIPQTELHPIIESH